MNLKEYQVRALETESKPSALAVNPIGLHRTLTICIAAANMLNLIKRSMFYAKELPQMEFHQHLAKIVSSSVSLANDVAGLPDPNSGMLPYLDGEDKAAAANLNLRLAHGAIGIFTEAGETLEQLLHNLETGTFDKVNLAEEVGGDIPWYQAVIFDEAGIDPEEALDRNIQKLQDKQKGRYKAGTFSSEEAVNRDTTAERQLLEGATESKADRQARRAQGGRPRVETEQLLAASS